MEEECEPQDKKLSEAQEKPPAIKERKNEVTEVENSEERPQLFGIPIDFQSYRVSQGPKRSGEGKNKRRIQRYGTIWSQQQKMPTTREKVLRRMKTEARTKEEEKDDLEYKRKKEGKVADGVNNETEDVCVTPSWKWFQPGLM